MRETDREIVRREKDGGRGRERGREREGKKREVSQLASQLASQPASQPASQCARSDELRFVLLFVSMRK